MTSNTHDLYTLHYLCSAILLLYTSERSKANQKPSKNQRIYHKASISLLFTLSPLPWDKFASVCQPMFCFQLPKRSLHNAFSYYFSNFWRFPLLFNYFWIMSVPKTSWFKSFAQVSILVHNNWPEARQMSKSVNKFLTIVPQWPCLSLMSF